MNKEKEEKKEKKNRSWIVILILIIIILILLFCHRCTISEPVVNQPVIEKPVGNYTVGGKQEKPAEEKPVEDVKNITLSGYGKYEVSENDPTVELSNPEGNFVDMVFTLTDKETGELIAKTGKVSAGNYVYVNVIDFYKKAGNYNVLIEISTFDGQSGEPMNGLNEEMELVVN